MKLKVIGSGSLENGYILIANTGETLMIEAGCHLDKLEATMDWDFSGIVGCIISHRHMDHAKWIGKYMEAGIPCHMNQDTADHWKVKGNLIESEQQFKLGNFTIKPFEVEHDVPCLAFLIDHPESGTMFFITDSSYCKWNFQGLKIRNWLVECNYDFAMINANYKGGKLDKDRYDRILEGHFGLQNCKDFLSANDMSNTIRIVLLHASKKNGNTVLFKKEIEDHTGRDVFIAKAGLVIDNFGPEPF